MGHGLVPSGAFASAALQPWRFCGFAPAHRGQTRLGRQPATANACAGNADDDLDLSRAGESDAARSDDISLASYGSRCSAISMLRNGLAVATELLPSPVGPEPRRNTAAPSVQSGYRTFVPTTSCSAPVPRIGTRVVPVLAAWTSPLAAGRQVLTFPYKSLIRLRAAYMPDVAAAVFFRTASELIPGPRHFPVLTSPLAFRHVV